MFGFDLSKHAVMSAAKEARRTNAKAVYAVSSIFKLPLRDGFADILTNIFAPCAETEFSRVLKKGGYLIVASAGRDHLIELKEALYDKAYKNDLRGDLPISLELAEKYNVNFLINLDSCNDIENLFSMTPYFYRTGKEGFERLRKLESIAVTVDVDIAVYRR